MLIDSHTHLERTAENVDSAADLVRSMDAAGIGLALVFAGENNGCSNDWLLEQVASFPDRLRAVASIAPRDGCPMSLDAFAALVARSDVYGLKLYPGYEHFFPADAVVRPYLEIMARIGKPVIFHSGDLNGAVGGKLKYAQPLAVDDLAAELRDLKIVIAHLGFPWMTDAAMVCRQNPNVHADLSGLTLGHLDQDEVGLIRGYLADFVRICPNPSKVLFGTDWSVCDQTDYARELPRVIADTYGPDAVGLVMCENARRVFGL